MSCSTDYQDRGGSGGNLQIYDEANQKYGWPGDLILVTGVGGGGNLVGLSA